MIIINELTHNDLSLFNNKVIISKYNNTDDKNIIITIKHIKKDVMKPQGFYKHDENINGINLKNKQDIVEITNNISLKPQFIINNDQTLEKLDINKK